MEEIPSLFEVARSGDLDLVKTLIENGADIHETSDCGWTPINAASDKGHIEVVKLLLESVEQTSTPNPIGAGHPFIQPLIVVISRLLDYF